MARQFIYFMQGLTKSYPTRKVLDNIHLSFYPDAKIGVLGVNGSGKSTLLKIMAGLDKEYNGEGLGRPGRPRRLSRTGAASRSDTQRARERHAGRRQAEGHPRSLQ
ncbi:ATPase subunit of ABC transporter with duplicated ATPase domains [Bradyrhizobium sp. LM6.11]